MFCKLALRTLARLLSTKSTKSTFYHLEGGRIQGNWNIVYIHNRVHRITDGDKYTSYAEESSKEKWKDMPLAACYRCEDEHGQNGGGATTVYGGTKNIGEHEIQTRVGAQQQRNTENLNAWW